MAIHNEGTGKEEKKKKSQEKGVRKEEKKGENRGKCSSERIGRCLGTWGRLNDARGRWFQQDRIRIPRTWPWDFEQHATALHGRQRSSGLSAFGRGLAGQ